jgi:REP element-mobilizing transposase RayT
MANTYTQIILHLVYATKFRNAYIGRDWKVNLEKYISGIVQNHKHKLLAIGTMPDHIHILIGYDVNQKIPDLVENIKTSSTIWINENKLSASKFARQKGYGVFSHSRSQLDRVAKYVCNQEEHHKQNSFKKEYNEFLKENNIYFDNRYLFEFFEPEI